MALMNTCVIIMNKELTFVGLVVGSFDGLVDGERDGDFDGAFEGDWLGVVVGWGDNKREKELVPISVWYPFSEIVGNSNVLIMPSQHSAAISYNMI